MPGLIDRDTRPPLLRPSLLAVSVLAATVLAVAPPAGAQEDHSDLVWVGQGDAGGASLLLGLPESDYIPIAFTCAAGDRQVLFSFDFAPIIAETGVSVIVTLEAGAISILIKTRGRRIELDDGFVLEGPTPLDARLIDLLTSRGTLEVFVEDGSEDYALDGAREAAQPLIAACASL